MDFIKRFKERHIKHRYFYKLYRLLKYRPNKSYAAWGEDIIVARIFKIGRFKKQNYRGVFVDVGSNHPIAGSTTYPLYKMGWRGLNIDLTADNIALSKRWRPRDVSLQCAISEKAGEIDSYIFDPGSGLNTLDKEAADHGARLTGKAYETVKVQAMPLNKAIEDHLHVDKIDVLNVDVEGHEMSVLRTFDFNRFAPDVVVCEIHCQTLEDLLAQEVYQLITSKGYHSISYCGSTALFARNGFDYTL